jgi:hypothetical protein
MRAKVADHEARVQAPETAMTDHKICWRHPLRAWQWRMALALLLACASPAIAQEVPEFDIEAACHGTPNKNGETGTTGELRCKNIETLTKKIMLAEWEKTPQGNKQYCIYWAVSHFPHSYHEMADCLAKGPEAKPLDRPARMGAEYFYPGLSVGLPMLDLQSCSKVRDSVNAGTCVLR